jgi:hypothetical protein
MTVSMVVLAFLLQGGAPAAHDVHDLETFSLCVSEGVEPGGKVRYVGDPFETFNDEMDARAYQEYVDQAYLHRRDSGYTAACKTYPSRADAEKALEQALKPVAGTKIVSTKWRAHFE